MVGNRNSSRPTAELCVYFADHDKFCVDKQATIAQLQQRSHAQLAGYRISNALSVYGKHSSVLMNDETNRNSVPRCCITIGCLIHNMKLCILFHRTTIQILIVRHFSNNRDYWVDANDKLQIFFTHTLPASGDCCVLVERQSDGILNFSPIKMLTRISFCFVTKVLSFASYTHAQARRL